MEEIKKLNKNLKERIMQKEFIEKFNEDKFSIRKKIKKAKDINRKEIKTFNGHNLFKISKNNNKLSKKVHENNLLRSNKEKISIRERIKKFAH